MQAARCSPDIYSHLTVVPQLGELHIPAAMPVFGLLVFFFLVGFMRLGYVF